MYCIGAGSDAPATTTMVYSIAPAWRSLSTTDATDELASDGDFEHASCTANFVAFLELEIITEDDGADVVFLEIQGEGCDLFAGLGRGHLEHLAGHRFLQAIDTRDSIFDFEHGADFFDVELVEVRRFDFAEKNVLDFAGAKDRVSGHYLLCSEAVCAGGSRNRLAGGV